MDALLDKPTKKRRGSINKPLALEQAKRGLNNVEIAKLHGVDQSAVWYFLNKSKPEVQALEDFKAHRADYFANFQAKCLQLQQKIIDSFFKDGIFESLKSSEKTGLLMALNASAGTSFDKERLERGKSTENVQVLNKLITEAHTSLFAVDRKQARATSTASSTELAETRTSENANPQ